MKIEKIRSKIHRISEPFVKINGRRISLEDIYNQICEIECADPWRGACSHFDIEDMDFLESIGLFRKTTTYGIAINKKCSFKTIQKLKDMYESHKKII